MIDVRCSVIAVAAALLLAGSSHAAEQDQGKIVFGQWCSACHAAGPRYPGTFALDTRYGGQMPAALEARTDLSPDIVKYFVRNGVQTMPFFRKTEISDSDLDALAAYLSAKK